MRAAPPYLGQELLGFPAPPDDRVGDKVSVAIRGKLGPFRASASALIRFDMMKGVF